MQIIAKCPQCNRSWLLDSSAADRRVTCVKCSKRFKIPAAEEMGKAMEIINNSDKPVYVDNDGKIYS